MPYPAAAPAVKAPLHVSSTGLRLLWDESVEWVLSHYLQILIAGCAGAVIVLVLFGLRHLGGRLCRQRVTLTHWPQTVGRVVAATRGWFIVLFAARLVLVYAEAPPLVVQTVATLFTVASALQGALWVRELILGVIEHRAGAEHHQALGSAIGIIRLLVTVVLFAIAGVAILDNLGVNVTGLIAGLGIGGIAIGLAAKGIFDDLFSALSIIFDRPFQRGDAIQWDKTSGTVEAIGLKTTRVRALTGEEVVISNTNLLAKELHNMARLARRRIVLTLGLAYYTPPDVCARVPEMVKRVVEGQDKCKLVRCGLVDFGASSLDFELQFDVYSDIYDEVFAARHAICVGLLDALNRARIDFAWPTQTTISAGPDGRPTGLAPADDPPPPAPPPSADPPAPTAREIAPE